MKPVIFLLALSFFVFSLYATWATWHWYFEAEYLRAIFWALVASRVGKTSVNFATEASK